ncbi:MAG: LolA family protein [Alphaproteobacteria bacterium]
MIRLKTIALACVAVLAPLSVTAETTVEDIIWNSPDAPATTTEAEDLARIEAYMDGIETLQARFYQTAPNRYVSTGTLSLQKPGKLRFEYEPPSPLLVVSNGSAITLIDYDLKQVTRWPINDTPLRPLVRANLAFGDDVEIVDLERSDAWIRVSVVDPENRDEGTMRLVFKREPFELNQWEVIDGRGQVTIVALDDMEKNVALDESLWKWDDPRPQRTRRLPGKR